MKQFYIKLTGLYAILSLLGMMAAERAYSSHISGGDISYQCVGQDSFMVTLNLFRDCDGISMGTSQSITLNSSCGGTVSETLNLQNTGGTEISQLCPQQIPNSTCNGGTQPGMQLYTYTGLVVLSPSCSGTWTASWSTCCRNTSVNIANSSSESTYLEATINTADAPCNNSPIFTAQPIPYVCINQLVEYNYGVVEYDGDSLAYSIVCGWSAAGTPLTYNAGYSCTAPIPGITIDPNSGQLSFTPTLTGNFVVVVMVEEYDANGNLIGTNYRDIQFVVQNCSNITPTSLSDSAQVVSGTGNQTGPWSFELCEGESVCFEMSFADSVPPSDPNYPALSSDSIFISSNVDSVFPGATLSQTGYNPATVQICISSFPGGPPVTSFTIEAEDNACPVTGIYSKSIVVDLVASTFAWPDQIICGDQWAELYVAGGDTFAWNVVSGDPMVVPTNFSCDTCDTTYARPSVTTAYEVVSNLSGGCKNRDTVTVTVVPDFTPVATGDDTLCNYGSVQLNTNVTPTATYYTYNWNNAGSLDDNTIPNPLATPLQTTNYVVSVESDSGCVKTDTVTVKVNDPPNLSLLPGDTVICDSSFIQFDVVTTQFEEDFNSGPDMSIWSNIENGTANTDCGSTSGDALHFDSSSGSRKATTIGLNTSSCTTVDFCLFMGNSSSGGAPCENADSGEDVELQYSTDGGATWNTMQLFDESDWDANPIWQCFSITIPAAAQTSNTMFQWEQISFSSCTGCDNWALEDVNLNCGGLSSYTYEWDNPGSLNDPNISNPVASPNSTTTYTVTATNSDNGCSYTASQTIDVVSGFTFTLTQTDTFVCLSESVQFTLTPNSGSGYTYSWFPGEMLDDTAIANPTATFTSSGWVTHYVIISTTSGCAVLDSVSVYVSANYPPDASATALDTFLCSPGDTTQLDVNTGPPIPTSCGLSTTGCGATTSDITVGTGTATNTSTTYPAPYGNWYWGAKHQILYTAAELNALGFSGGKISELAFNIATINGTTTYNDFEIKMGCTNLTDLTTWQTGLSTVFPAQNINIVTGWNTHTFANAFEWDGLSNIIVEVCFNNSSYTNNSETYYTPTTYNSVIWYRTDASTVCSSTSITGTGMDRPNTRFTICNATGSNSGLIYQWSPSTNLISDDTAKSPYVIPPSTSTYTVTVTDTVGGCWDTASVTVYLLEFDSIESAGMACYGDTLGSIEVYASGGVTPFTYSIDSGASFQASNTFTNLSPGTYSVIVQDNSLCQTSDTVTLTEPPPLTMNFQAFDDSCFAACKGYAVVIPNGGTPGPGSQPYTITWSSGATNTQIHNNLCAGNHSVTITDANSCSIDTNFVINEPPALLIDSVSVTEPSCSGYTDGSFTVHASGGTTPYQYSIDSTNSYGATNTFTSISSDTFYISVMDANNCQIDQVLFVDEPDELVIGVSGNTTVCVGSCAIISVNNITGGNGSPYTYNWNNGIPNISQYTVCPSSPTTYTVFVEDTMGCPSSVQPIEVDLFAPLSVSIAPSSTSICPGDMVTLNAIATGGTGNNYDYEWEPKTDISDPFSSNPVADPDTTATYTVILNDDDCNTPADTAQVTIIVNPVPVADFIADKTEECSPIRVEFTNNSTLADSCVWNLGDGNGNITTDCGTLIHDFTKYGDYDVSLEVFTNNGCNDKLSKSKYITAFPNPLADFYASPQPTTVLHPDLNFKDLSIVPFATIEEWLWQFDELGYSDKQNPSFEFPADTGLYQVMLTVTTDDGCVHDTMKYVQIDTDIGIHIPNAFSPNNDGKNDHFKPQGVGIIENKYSFLIFNRWGEVLFKSNKFNEGWDGTYLGEPVPPGVYVWKIVAHDFTPNKDRHERMGHVVLLR